MPHRKQLRRRVLPVSLAALTTFSGCVPPYRPPSAAEPHARATFVYEYEEMDGEMVNESLELNGSWVFENHREAAKLPIPYRFETLLRPGRNVLGFWTIFYTDPTDEEQKRDMKAGQYSGRRVGDPCREERAYLAEAGHAYNLRFTYQAPGSCTVLCMDRTTGNLCTDVAR
jgi:hypothetical protein